MSWFGVGHSGEEGKFVGVLAGSWHSDGPRPVEVHVAHFVSDELELVCIEAIFIAEDIVAAGTHGTLTGSARDQVKVVPENQKKAKQVSFIV